MPGIDILGRKDPAPSSAVRSPFEQSGKLMEMAPEKAAAHAAPTSAVVTHMIGPESRLVSKKQRPVKH